MELVGSHLISADRETVWRALNDPEILRVCIPGCQSLDMTSETQMSATVGVKIGPVKAKFKGDIVLSDLNPPESYTITGEGKGGIAGFAKGGAKVMLSDESGGTLLSYEVDAKVGGKLAQLGSRLIDSTAQKLAKEFFANFGDHLGGA